jgi:hypothetical protein
MKKQIICFIGAIFLVLWTSACSPSKKTAERVANEWLKVVDAGNYAQSWDSGASIFKLAVAKEQWLQILGNNRAPLGAVASREIESAEYTSDLPGAPDGEYYVIRYASTFANRKPVTETVTSVLDRDGKWRVAVYVVK